MDSTVALILAVVLLAGNAFFVAAEFALISVRRSTIEPQAIAGSRRAKTTLGALENVSMMMAGAQLGITLCSLGLGALGEPAIAYFLAEPLTNLHIPHHLLHPISFVIALGIMTFLHVVLGEMVPKNITLANPNRSALLLAPMLRRIVRLLLPAVKSLNALANWALRLVGVRPRQEVSNTFTRDEVADLVEESRREGLLSEEKEHLITGTLRFDKRKARNILLPADKLISIKKDTPITEIEALVAQTGFSRFPVKDGDQFIGYVHVKDILQEDEKKPKTLLSPKAIRGLARIRATDNLRTILARMQHAGSHMALVVGSKNEILGAATLEDALEELVGEILDEGQNLS